MEAALLEHAFEESLRDGGTGALSPLLTALWMGDFFRGVSKLEAQHALIP